MDQAALLRVLSKLPLSLLYLLSRLVYAVSYYVLRFRKEVVLTNLKNAFPEKSDREIQKLARCSYKNLAEVLVEAIKAISLSEEELKKRVRIANQEIFDEFAKRGQSVVLLAAHQCNWEWLLLASCLKLPFPVDAVYKPLHIGPVDKLMVETRSRFGGSLIPVKSFIIEITRRKNSQRAFAIVADQTPLRRDEKYWTTFLNQDTAFYVGPQKIATLTGAPVVFMRMKRTRRGYYDVLLTTLARPPYSKDGYQIVERYIREVEKEILQSPADWFWLHQKWKYKKPLYT